MSRQETTDQEIQTRKAVQFILSLAGLPNTEELIIQILNSYGVTREIASAKRLEQIFILMLHQLPISLTITPRENNHYVWEWLGARGEKPSFLEALDEALSHIEIAYIESNELS